MYQDVTEHSDLEMNFQEIDAVNTKESDNLMVESDNESIQSTDNIDSNNQKESIPSRFDSISYESSKSSDSSSSDHETSNEVKARKKKKSSVQKPNIRARLSYPSQWLHQTKKLAVNSGMPYINECGTSIPARDVLDPCDISCRKKCQDRLLLPERIEINKKFWALADHNRQWNYLNTTCIEINNKQSNVDNITRRKKSISYKFKINNEDITVCKEMFLNTLNISDAWIRSISSKSQKGFDISPDKRGRHGNRANKISEDVELLVIEHINSFPRTESHYVRKTTTREYLEENLSIKTMYDLYLKWMKKNHKDSEVASQRNYRDIFNNKFNISFFKPKKDQCELCTI